MTGVLLLDSIPTSGILKEPFPFWKGPDFVQVLAMYTQNYEEVTNVNLIAGVSAAPWFFQNMVCLDIR